MRRRKFITLLSSAAAAWPVTARAQKRDGARRIGVLNWLADTPPTKARIAAFAQEFQNLGWTEGRNFRIDYRWASGNEDQVRAYADELVGMTPDVILAVATPALRALHQKTRTTPIVFLLVSDPVDGGFVESLARPGGNITGFTNLEFSMAGRWLELLKQIAPNTARVAVIQNPMNPTAANWMHAIDAAAPSLGLRVTIAAARNTAEIERAIVASAAEPNTGLVVLPEGSTTANHKMIAELENRHGVPAIHAHRFFATSGGLVSYGPNDIEQFRQAASYVDRILKGEKPGNLPVQAPTKYELVINLKTAKALNLTVPPKLLFTADEVIE